VREASREDKNQGVDIRTLEERAAKEVLRDYLRSGRYNMLPEQIR